jgi:hypothetical protein
MIPPSEGSFCEESISFLLLFVVTKNKEKGKSR